MSAKDQRDYIAIQVLGALLSHEHMAVEQAIASVDIGETESHEWLEDITNAALVIAERMADKLRDDTGPGGEV